MRRLLAAVVDTAAVLLLGYLAFRVAEVVTSCGSSTPSCPMLAPLVVLFALLAAAIYFVLSFVWWRSTPGERICKP